MPSHWPEQPRITDGSRWFRPKDRQIYKQVGTLWESKLNPCASYIMRCEQTGEETTIKNIILYDAITKKQLVEIGDWRLEDILKNVK